MYHVKVGGGARFHLKHEALLMALLRTKGNVQAVPGPDVFMAEDSELDEVDEVDEVAESQV